MRNFITLMAIIVLFVNTIFMFQGFHDHNSRLKSLEASLHSAQQPQERNYFGVSDDTVFIKHGECITFKGQRIFAK